MHPAGTMKIGPLSLTERTNGATEGLEGPCGRLHARNLPYPLPASLRGLCGPDFGLPPPFLIDSRRASGLGEPVRVSAQGAKPRGSGGRSRPAEERLRRGPEAWGLLSTPQDPPGSRGGPVLSTESLASVRAPAFFNPVFSCLFARARYLEDRARTVPFSGFTVPFSGSMSLFPGPIHKCPIKKQWTI